MNNGAATFATSSLGFGSNWVTSEYSGDLLNPPATNGLNQAVVYGTPVISSSSTLTGGFQLNLSGPNGQPYRILSTTNLALPGSWIVEFSNVFGTGQSVFTEPDTAGKPSRFYRVVSP